MLIWIMNDIWYLTIIRILGVMKVIRAIVIMKIYRVNRVKTIIDESDYMLSNFTKVGKLIRAIRVQVIRDIRIIEFK
jgi:hypothetical protein